MFNQKKLQLLALFISLISLLALSGCNIVDGIRGNSDDPDDTLHPVLLNDQWGFINQKGKIVINPQFDQARDAAGGFAAVRSGTLWGFVQADPAELVIPPAYASTGNFEDGLAPAQLPGGLYGYINERGDFEIEAQFDFAASFSDGLAAVRTDGLWGYVDINGNMAIEAVYSDARPFSGGLAAVETFDGWIYIDREGQTVVDPGFQITEAGEFIDGIAPIQTVDGWGFMDRSGTPVITPEYADAGNFNDGRAWVDDDGYIGFIDKKGTFIIPPQFAEVKAFSEGMAAVRLSSDWFYISKKTGRIVINQPFEYAESFLNGIARVQEGSGSDARFGYINKAGEYIWYPSN